MTDRWTPQEKLLLAVICGVVFLDTLDLSLVQVALPSIGSALHLGQAPLQWIVSAFVLGYGGFLLLGGRCADVLGRRRVLLAGLIALAAASALGTVASDPTLLIATRFIKGVSAAFTAPAALSILTTSFAEGQRRNRALGLYAAGAAAGFTFGLVVGGLLTELSWRYTFAAVVPVALVLFIATPSHRATGREDEHDARPARSRRCRAGDRRDARLRPRDRHRARGRLALGTDADLVRPRGRVDGRVRSGRTTRRAPARAVRHLPLSGCSYAPTSARRCCSAEQPRSTSSTRSTCKTCSAGARLRPGSRSWPPAS